MTVPRSLNATLSGASATKGGGGGISGARTDGVASLDSTRDPWSASARKGNAAPGHRELFRQLASRLAAAHDEDVPWRERGRVGVVFSVDDVDGGWKLSGCRWSMCLLVSAGGEDDTFRADLTRGRSEEEGSILRHLEAGHRHTFAHRRPKTLRVGDKVTDDLLLRHEPVRVVSTVPSTGQLHRPVGNDKAEAVPAPTPRLANPSSLENDVLATGGSDLVAQGKPGLPSADDDDVNDIVFHRVTRTARVPARRLDGPRPTSLRGRSRCAHGLARPSDPP